MTMIAGGGCRCAGGRAGRSRCALLLRGRRAAQTSDEQFDTLAERIDDMARRAGARAQRAARTRNCAATSPRRARVSRTEAEQRLRAIPADARDATRQHDDGAERARSTASRSNSMPCAHSLQATGAAGARRTGPARSSISAIRCTQQLAQIPKRTTGGSAKCARRSKRG